MSKKDLLRIVLIATFPLWLIPIAFVVVVSVLIRELWLGVQGAVELALDCIFT